MEDVGSDSVLKLYDDQGHGFFNYNRGHGENSAYQQTINEMDVFLTKHGFLSTEK